MNQTFTSDDNTDFIEVLVEHLNAQKYYKHIVFPYLPDGNSIAISPMPSNDYDYYYDGSYRQRFSFQVMTKHEEQMEAWHTLLSICTLLKDNVTIQSANGSFENEGIAVTTDPNLIMMDERHFVCGAQFVADLYVQPLKEE